MTKKHIKINETAIIGIALLVIVIPLFAAYQSKKDLRSPFQKQYEIDPTNREAVKNYSSELIDKKNYEQAFLVVDSYFQVTPKDIYWSDANLLVNHAMSAVGTKRCSVAIADGWRITNITEQTDWRHEFGGAVVGQALNEDGCIE